MFKIKSSSRTEQLDFSHVIEYYLQSDAEFMLSGKQKRQLRADANQLRPSVIIGKEGVTPELMTFLAESFNRRELIKIRVLDSCPDDVRVVAGQISGLKNSELVQILGRTLLLYRPMPVEPGASLNEV
jgi:RNA-binding protein